MKLSEHFTLEELTFSEFAVRNGLDNTPSDQCVENLRKLCERVLEPLRTAIMQPIIVTSGFRSPAVNAGIGGTAHSQHCEGKAADIIVPGMSIDQLFAIVSGNLQYDQVIHEFGRWVHVSYSEQNRKMKLKAVKENGTTVYLNA